MEMVGDYLGIYTGFTLYIGLMGYIDYFNILKFSIGIIIAIYLTVLFSAYFYFNLIDKW